MQNFPKKNIKNNKKYKKLENYNNKSKQKNTGEIMSPVSIGFEHGLYFAGFSNALSALPLAEESIANIIMTKMSLEYQQEMARMKFETEQRIAEIYASASTEAYYED